MKIIGEKLSRSEMLTVKGGACRLCYCSDWSGVWYADYSNDQQIEDDLTAFCGGTGNGNCDVSSFCEED